VHPAEPVWIRRGVRGAHLPSAPLLDPRHQEAARRGGEAGMSARRTGEPVPLLESIASHLVLVLAVAFALYPMLWVVSLGLSASHRPPPDAFPSLHDITAAHLKAVMTTSKTTSDGTIWLFGRQFANSIVVALATAVTGVIIAVPAAYALARFKFLGKEGG